MKVRTSNRNHNTLRKGAYRKEKELKNLRKRKLGLKSSYKIKYSNNQDKKYKIL